MNKAYNQITYSDYELIKQQLAGTNYRCIVSFIQFLYCYDLLDNVEGFEKCHWPQQEVLQKGFQRRKELLQKRNTTPYEQSLKLEEIERIQIFSNNLSDENYKDKNSLFALIFYLTLNLV